MKSIVANKNHSFSGNVLIIFFALLLILLLVAPASAASLSVEWDDQTALSDKILKPTNSSSLVYSFKEVSTQDIEFTLIIKNADNPEYGVGYSLSYPKDYIGRKSEPTAVVKSHSYKYDPSTNEGKLKLIIEPKSAVFDVNVAVKADASKVYHNESAKISASMTQGGQTVSSSDAQVKVQYPPINSSLAFNLQNPSRMPMGPETIDMTQWFRLSDYSTYVSSGFGLYADSITFDYSDIAVYANGTPVDTTTFASSGDDLLSLVDLSDSTYDINVDNANHKITYKLKNGQQISLHGKYMPLKIKVTDNFTNSTDYPAAPTITFSNIKITAENLSYNKRGPIVQFLSGYTSESNMPNIGYKSNPKFTAVTSSEHLDVKLDAPVLGDSDMVRQIINSDSGIFEYQNLFKVQITNKMRDGSDEEITFTIPDKVKVTHLRIPPYSNNQTSYSKISIWNETKGGYDELSPGSGKTYNLTSYNFGYGDNVTLKIESIIRMTPSPSASSSESASHMITFIGQVDTTSFVPITFDAYRKDTNNKLNANTLALTVRDSYTVMPYINSQQVLTSSKTSYLPVYVPELVQRGDTFYMYTDYSPSSYPYYSVLRFDPMNPSATTALSNPIIYFSIPGGLIAGDAEVTTSTGVVTEYKTYDGSTVNSKNLKLTQRVLEKEGLYKDDGGYVVEVKINVDGTGSENTDTFWARNAIIRLPVTVSDDFEGIGFTFEPNSVIVSTWDPNAYNVHIGGSGGRNSEVTTILTKPENLVNVKSSAYGTYSQYSFPITLPVASDSSVSAGAGVKMPSGYVSYKSGSSDTHPKLHAGSSNEEFRVTFKNRISNTVVDEASIYFILPSNATGWSPELIPQNSLDITVSGKTGVDELKKENITVYYTTDAVGNSYDLAGAESLSWTEINPANINSLPWDKINGIKCHVLNAPGDSGFNLILPFKLPDVKVADLSDSNKFAVGQTLYLIEIEDVEDITSNDGFTAAIELIESKPPAIVNSEGNEFNSEYLVEYNAEEIPAILSDGLIVRDDFTAVSLDKIKIETKAPGSASFTTVDTYATSPTGDEKRLSDVISSASYSATIDSQSYVGYTYTFKSSMISYIKGLNNTLGEHKITFTSVPDNDLNPAAAAFTIVVSKDSDKVILTPGSATYNMSHANSLPMYLPNDITPTPDDYNWDKYLTHYVTVSDYGSPHDVSKFVRAADSTFSTIKEPGKYVMNYSYNTPGLSESKLVSVPVTVVLYDDLLVKAVADGVSLSELEVYVDDGVLSPITALYYDSSKLGYPTIISGTAGTPQKAQYTIFYSNIPNGLKDKNGGNDDGQGNLTVNYHVQYGDPTYTTLRTLTFDPITISAKATGELKNSIVSVSLYEVNDTGADKRHGILYPTIPDGATDFTFTFAKESGEGWFEDGDYYVVAELMPGYVIDASSTDFTQDSDEFLIWASTEETLAHEDLSFELEIVKAPFVSGIAWNDVNKNSVMDDSESVLSGVKIELYDNSNTLVDTVQTKEDGYYCFYGMPEGFYYIKAVPTGGYQLSDFVMVQTVNKDNENRSDVFELGSVGMWQENMHVGLYSESGKGGNGYGDAYVINSTSGGTVLVEGPDGDVKEPGYSAPLPEIENKAKFPWYILLILAVLIIAGVVIVVVIKKYKR